MAAVFISVFTAMYPLSHGSTNDVRQIAFPIFYNQSKMVLQFLTAHFPNLRNHNITKSE